MDQVRCRAEHSYPGRPLEVWFEGKWYTVVDVIDEAQTPEGRAFRVVCEQSMEFYLEYQLHENSWQVTLQGFESR